MRRAIAAASISLLLAIPTFALAVGPRPEHGEPLGTSIFNHVIQRLCEVQQAGGNRVRLVDPARCLPPPPAAPMLTVTKVVVNDNGGTATVNAFALFIDGATTTSGVAIEVSAGVHTVTENPSANYFATFGGDCSANGTVTLSAGESKECIITNNDVAPPLPGTLIVDKVTEPSGSTRVFDVMVTGTGAITGGGAGTTTDAVNKNYEVEAGTYSVTETVPSGWTQVSNTCTNVVVGAGETEVCTITNRKEPTITVVKMVVNDDGGTATSSDFMIHVHDMSGTTTVDVAGSPQVGSTSGTTYTVAPGLYHVAETGGPADYSMTVGGDCAADGSITLAAGDDKTCTVTNNDIAPTPPGQLIVDKITYPSGDTQVFSISTTGTGAITGSATGTVSDATNKEYQVTAGTYSITETMPDGWAQVSNYCASVAVQPGGTAVCTISNVKLATITIEKVVVNDNGGTATSSDFTIHLHRIVGENMIDVDGSPQPGSASGTVYNNLATSTYHVAETGGPDGYTTTFSGACDENGNIAVDAGESRTCTVTNNDNPPATTTVVISEIMYNPPDSDDTHEWIEVMNGTGGSVDLTNWRFFEDDTNHGLTVMQGSSTVAADGFAIVADNAAQFLLDYPSFTGILFDSAFSLGNTSETISLKNGNGDTVDEVTYSSSQGANGDGYSLQKTTSGWAAAAPTPGS